MELIGEFHFDAPRHYSARESVNHGGDGRQSMVANFDCNMLDAEWVSDRAARSPPAAPIQ
jgi:hypothetical protein